MTNDEKLTLAREALEKSAIWIENITRKQLDLWRETKVAEIRRALAAITTESAPAAGVASIDGPKLIALLDDYKVNGSDGYYVCYQRILAHINAFAAQQREEGRAEGIEQTKREDTALILAERERAEKAEAALAQRAAGDIAAKMPCGAAVSNVYEAYEAGKLAARAVGGVELTDAEIERIFLSNGFTIKDGHSGLKAYVFRAARALLAAAPAAPEIPADWRKFVTDCTAMGGKMVEGNTLSRVAFRLLSKSPAAPVGDGDERALTDRASEALEYCIKALESFGVAKQSREFALQNAREVRAALTQQKGN